MSGPGWGVDLIWRPARQQPDKIVCLTLDDGPNGDVTRHVLDLLGRAGIKATFFLIGQNVARDRTLVQRIVGEGHEAGNHSYNHDPLLAFKSPAAIRANLDRASRLIADAAGVAPRYFRAPYGIMTPRLRAACADLDLISIGVQFFVADSQRSDGAAVARDVLGQMRGGSGILVLHDGFGTLPASFRSMVTRALAIVVPAAVERGYRWGRLDELQARPE